MTLDIKTLLEQTTDQIRAELEMGIISKQSIIDCHLLEIEELSKRGVSYKKIIELGNIPLKLKHFYSLIHQAKSKVNNAKRK